MQAKKTAIQCLVIQGRELEMDSADNSYETATYARASLQLWYSVANCNFVAIASRKQSSFTSIDNRWA